MIIVALKLLEVIAEYQNKSAHHYQVGTLDSDPV